MLARPEAAAGALSLRSSGIADAVPRSNIINARHARQVPVARAQVGGQ
jgi:hypothetical protein